MDGTSFKFGGAQPVDNRYVRNVYKNAVKLANPTIAGQANTMTSAGTVGGYSISFAPVIFSSAPIVVAWCAKESGGNPILINVDGVTATAFTFDLIIPASSAAINAGHTCLVEWIAVGS